MVCGVVPVPSHLLPGRDVLSIKVKNKPLEIAI